MAYIENIAILSEASAALYTGRRIHPNGYSWIRTGLNQKLFDNGQLAWELEYDNLGELVKRKYTQYRKDGSIIQY